MRSIKQTMHSREVDIVLAATFFLIGQIQTGNDLTFSHQTCTTPNEKKKQKKQCMEQQHYHNITVTRDMFYGYVAEVHRARDRPTKTQVMCRNSYYVVNVPFSICLARARAGPGLSVCPPRNNAAYHE